MSKTLSDEDLAWLVKKAAEAIELYETHLACCPPDYTIIEDDNARLTHIRDSVAMKD